MRRVLLVPCGVGLVALGCGGDGRDFGAQRSEAVTGDAAVADGGDGAVTVSDLTQAGDAMVRVTTDTSGPTPEAGPPGPTLDGPCTKGGARSCDTNDPKQTLVCSQGRWQSNGGCSKKENCDPEVGACSEILSECSGRNEGDRFCQPDDELWECGANLVNATRVEACEGVCAVDGDSAQCEAPRCGDAKVEGLEVCDDGNEDENDECTTTCVTPSCGDGVLQVIEVCDDGNDDESDECTSRCEPPACGDGIVQEWEVCEDDDTDEEDECTTLCKPPACGDGIHQSTEMCDDGNLAAGDSCSAACTHEVVDLATSYYHACARRADGQVKCWGNNDYGQLGIESNTPRGDEPYEMGAYLPGVSLGYGRSATGIATGFRHSCASLDDGNVKCWGANAYGQLGLGDVVTRGDEPSEMGDYLPELDLGTGVFVLQLAAGYYHNCALLNGGAVKCWGYNAYGQLGLEDTINRGDVAGQMGDYLPVVNLGSGHSAQQVAVGEFHSCALLDDGQVKCWGYGYVGSLGLGDAVSRGRSANEMGDYLTPVDLGAGRTALRIWAGGYQNCALLDDHSLKCWGYNYYGQLGLGDSESRGDSAGEMGDYLPVPNLGSEFAVASAAVGNMTTCGVSTTGELKCWGNNYYGELGLGDKQTRGLSSVEMGDALPLVGLGSGRTAVVLRAGASSECALLDNADVKCWGSNLYGQLGQGDKLDRGGALDQMGDALLPISLW